MTKQQKEIIEGSIAIPCTACQYCVKHCPKNIPILSYFDLYNNLKRSVQAPFYIQKGYYNNYIRDFGKASDCIGCRKCEQYCPQKLEISKHLKDVVRVFEEEDTLM